jgi:hypothetical protein
MAFLLLKFIRRKIRENEAKNAIPSTKDSELVESYLVPEVMPGHSQEQSPIEHGTTGNTTANQSHVEAFSAEEAARDEEEARRRNIRQWKLMLGLALPNFLASVDVTIVAPAIPLISSHFSMSLETASLQKCCSDPYVQTSPRVVSTGSLPHTR